MYYIGIDIGSTCAKIAALDENNELMAANVIPTGWNCVETAQKLMDGLADQGIVRENSKIVATGYGRVSVPFADKAVTEISCHGRGAAWLFKSKDGIVIDIGGQDTKIIEIKNGQVNNFIMNDKCSAGTGRFLDIMAGTMGVSLQDLCELAKKSTDHVTISSMCTVFAESEVVSLIGAGTSREDIAYGIIESIALKVRGQMGKINSTESRLYLTGGLCEVNFIRDMLSEKIGRSVESAPLARFAGAVGGALYAAKLR